MGCGRVAPKPELVRLAVEPSAATLGTVVLDARGTLPGRGAYLCRAHADADQSAEGDADARCLSAALRRNAIARTLRSRVAIDPKLVESVGP